MKKETLKLRRRVIITAVLASLAGLFIISIFGFQDEGQAAEQQGQEVQKIVSYAVPDSANFAGERVPLENYDTRESLDRELNSNAYFHSSTLLLIKRPNRFFPVIEPILARYGVPDDFKYVAVAESDLTNAISPAKAVGFWQFMSTTGKEYGLEINSEIDERYHLERSTEAACRYFLKSYERYGNWTMVAASYNRGSNGINTQVEIQGQDYYYDLLLPEETARYIFRILALKTIFNDPGKYGFIIDREHLYPEIPVEIVTVDSSVTSFASFAALFGTNYKILKAMNPWLRQPYLTNKSHRVYEIKVPVSNARTGIYDR